MAAIGQRAKNLSASGDCHQLEIHRRNSSQKYRSCRTDTVRTYHCIGFTGQMERSPRGPEAWMACHASLAISGTRAKAASGSAPGAQKIALANRPERAIHDRYNGATRPSGPRQPVLTATLDAHTLVDMRLMKPILLNVIAVAIALYAIDCGAMTTPDEAMQCCNSMPCSPHSQDHSQECCTTMPSTHAPFLQPASAHDLSFSPVLVAVLRSFSASQGTDSAADVLASHSHAPPIPQAAVPSPLRV
jgi:hypothetical protein